MNVRSLALLFGAMLILAAAVAPSRAQSPPKPDWSWPAKAKNLKVLPADTPPEKLRANMIGFTRALGVRCTHCHVGTEDQPLSTYDFPSDEKPNKTVARGMMRMLATVNDQLKQIRPDSTERVTMRCYTCHRGVPLPRTLVDELTLVYDKAGADSAAAHYAELRSAHDNDGAYDFREDGLNILGYRALGKKDVPGAVALFKLNVERFPGSGNVHDSLADGYLAAGDTAAAVAEYEAALRLDPQNREATKRLEALRR